MLHRHRIPTIFSIYMLDVICCALGCVILLWQVAHREAEDQTALAKASQTDALTQTAEALRTRLQFEQAHQDFLEASKDARKLQAALADWRAKYQSLLQALALTEKEREDARTTLDKTRLTLTLSAEQLKKLEAELAKLLAEEKKTSIQFAAAKKGNVDLLAQIAALKSAILTRQTEADLAAKKSQDQLVALKLSEENARKLKTLLDQMTDDSKTVQGKLKVAELQQKYGKGDGNNPVDLELVPRIGNGDDKLDARESALLEELVAVRKLRSVESA